MYEELKKILIEEMQIKKEDISPDAKLVADLGFNSLELADLVVLCEDKYNIEINEEDARGFQTVSDVSDYLESLIN